MKKFKGVQTIKDPALEPYFITKDEHCYTLKELVQPNSNHFRTQGEGKSYEKSLSYYPKIEQVLERIARLKMDSKDYNSLTEYINEFKLVNNNLIKFLEA